MDFYDRGFQPKDGFKTKFILFAILYVQCFQVSFNRLNKKQHEKSFSKIINEI